MMAQYYEDEALSQAEINGEPVGQFYNTQQQFQSQQLVVSSDQVMLVDGTQQQVQQVVIDQNQITFQQQNQTQQYSVIQDGSINNQQQQIFYMETNGTQQVDRVVVDQAAVQQAPPQNPQPIVLNHQLGSNTPIIRTKAPMPHPQGGPVRAALRTPHVQLRPQNRSLTPQTRPMNPMAASNAMNQQMRTSRAALPQHVRPPVPVQRALLNQQQKNQLPAMINRIMPGMPHQHQMPQQVKQSPKSEYPQQIKVNEMKEPEEDSVSLTDGAIVPLSVYKKMLADQKRNMAQRSAIQQNQPETPQTQAPKRGRNPNASPRKVNRGGTRMHAPARGGMNQFGQPPQPQPRPTVPNQPRYNLNQQQQMRQYQNQIMQQRLQQQQQQQQQMRARSQNNFIITPPQPNRPQQQMPLPSYIPSSQIQQIIENTPIAEEFSDSIRMLVLLENGEQRLITFTLPKEACTIQEILEQVNVPFTHETNIQVTEANTNGINYIVTVGNVPNFGNQNEEEVQEPPEPEPMTPPPPLQQLPPACHPSQPQTSHEHVLQPPPEPPKLPSPEPEPPKEVPKIIPGKLAVCGNCGYLSEHFNRCTRCTRALPDNVKAIPASTNIILNNKKNLENGNVQHQVAPTPAPIPPHITLKTTIAATSTTTTTTANVPKPPTPTKKRPSRAKIVEHESVVISSDEEEDPKDAKMNEELLKNLCNSVTISPVSKEPSFNDIKKYVNNKATTPPEDIKFATITVKCRTVRIGSYRFVPLEDVRVDTKQITIKVPHIENNKDIKTIIIEKHDIVKVLVSFNKALAVVFYYLNPAIAPAIRATLGMKDDSKLYFDPLCEKEECYRRITLLPEDFGDDHKNIFQQVYSSPPLNIMEELTPKEANDILIKTCPKDLSRNPLGMPGSYTEIKQILMYPPEGKGRISINTEDYVCLAQDQFLNDVIIDFYLKYLVENLPKEQQHKVHVFSTFFYKRLTTKPTKASRKSQPAEVDPSLSKAEKRHARVQKWTKNVNLFEKDFVVVPINENAHWFLAIICFPAMNGCETFDGKPYKIEPPKPKAHKTVKKEKPIICEEPVQSDKDEAEGDESELESDDSEEIPPTQIEISLPAGTKLKPKDPRTPIKQSCILLFDSLAGAGRSRVVATLRDYLTCEYKVKMNEERVYTKDIIKGANVKVPQQTNFTDCGLYLLQYVEQFFKDPIKDYRIPINTIKNWFEEITVTKKREDLANLIKQLMQENNKDIKCLPDIAFPTLNGKLVERTETELTEEEEEDMFTDIEDSQMTELETEQTDPDQTQSNENSVSAADVSGNESAVEGTENSTEKTKDDSPLKPSVQSVSDKSEIITHTIVNSRLKPDQSEIPVARHTNRDTLSILKAKRIIRHKNADGPDVKKSRTEINE